MQEQRQEQAKDQLHGADPGGTFLHFPEIPLHGALILLRQLFTKCMDNGLAVMPAPIFLVTDDPKATSGPRGDDHLLDVCHPCLFVSAL